MIGLLTMASSSVALSAAGVPFDPALQILTGLLGITLGGFLGARETA